jgi:hypothetical protein
MTVQDTLQKTINNTTKQRAIMVKEDEVLALAEKIRRQRKLDNEYLKAFNILRELKNDTSPSVGSVSRKKLNDHNYIWVKFYTESNTGYFDDTVVELPVQMGDDLINYLMEYTDALTPD